MLYEAQAKIIVNLILLILTFWLPNTIHMVRVPHVVQEAHVHTWAHRPVAAFLSIQIFF